MPTSRSSGLLPRPVRGEPLAASTKAYLRSRARHRLFEFIVRAFAKSKLTQAELAVMLGCDAPRVSRMLSAPANWEVDTVTDLFAAITLGKEVAYLEAVSPYDKPVRNDAGESLLTHPRTTASSGNTVLSLLAPGVKAKHGATSMPDEGVPKCDFAHAPTMGATRTVSTTGGKLPISN